MVRRQVFLSLFRCWTQISARTEKHRIFVHNPMSYL